MVTTGQKIREERERLALTQVDLAARLHVPQPTVSYWECGRREPTLAQARRLAAELGVSLDELVGAGPAARAG